MPNMTQIKQTYSLKIPQQEELLAQLDFLKELVTLGGQQLLERLWSEEWLEILGTSTKKAYKEIGEQQVQLVQKGQQIYLPSRIRRCIAERVGRILRSQAEKQQCYSDVLRLIQMTGFEGNLDSLVKIIAQTLVNLEGKYYKRALIRQSLRTFRRYHYKLGLDLQVLTYIPYTQMVKPTIRSFVLPYAPDDKQAIQYSCNKDEMDIRLKLPKISQPLTKNNWYWRSFTITIPPKIYQRLIPTTSSKCTLHLPTLRYSKLKGGLVLPFLDFSWTIQYENKYPLVDKRVMATDLGVLNLTTSVICEAGSQISQPIYWSPDKQLLNKIEKMYGHIAKIQKKLDRYPEQWKGQGKRLQESERLYSKLNRYRKNIIHLTSNYLLETALTWKCRTLVLEDLRNYAPPKNLRKLSRKLSNWLRGSLFEAIVYKAKRFGIRIIRVNAHWTSSYCPRCGFKGQKINNPSNKTVNKLGRFFFCPNCLYTADRDYIASVNIYRMFQEQLKKRYSLHHSKPVSYMGAVIPRDRLRGSPVHSSPNR